MNGRAIVAPWMRSHNGSDRLGRSLAAEHRAVPPSRATVESRIAFGVEGNLVGRRGSPWLGRSALGHLDQGDLHRVAARKRGARRWSPSPEIVAQGGGEEERHVASAQPMRRLATRSRRAAAAQERAASRDHAILGQRSGLVGADHGRRIRESRPTAEWRISTFRSAMRWAGEHEGERQRRKQAFGHHRDDDADREDEGIPERDAR